MLLIPTHSPTPHHSDCRPLTHTTCRDLAYFVKPLSRTMGEKVAGREAEKVPFYERHSIPYIFSRCIRVHEGCMYGTYLISVPRDWLWPILGILKPVTVASTLTHALSSNYRPQKSKRHWPPPIQHAQGRLKVVRLLLTTFHLQSALHIYITSHPATSSDILRKVHVLPLNTRSAVSSQLHSSNPHDRHPRPMAL
jgi:hypothetical protein